ncbi:MAG TPA: transketolase [Vicinamibacteria bacterium]|nr:transketolase [Vicinamibacteria bacterium]
MTTANPKLDQLCVDTIRALAIDTVQKANSGHPGLPLGAAPVGYSLFTRTMKHDPANPQWPDRDRFVLSAGHGSALLYSLLHLTGYDLPLDQLKQFRQWGSHTPGHPEYGDTPGVEVTTGPLGQGFAMAVGMAVAERHLAARFNRPGHEIVDHHTYVLAGDGDLMEGVAHEAASLAGHLELGRLVVFYDSNRICLAGSTGLSFTDDVRRVFEGYGWHVQSVADGNDLEALARATDAAKATSDQPSLVIVRTQIGYGSPKQGTFGVHGSPLGAEAVVETKRKLGYPSEEPFFIPDEALAHLRGAVERGKAAEAEWRSRFEAYRKAHPDLAAQFERAVRGELPPGWDADLPAFSPADKPIATRAAGGKVINAIAARVPELFGGSADLNTSTETALKGAGDFQAPDTAGTALQGAVGGEWGYGGRNIHYGVREHVMAAVSSGLALHGGLIPFSATFFTFADYMRPAIRLAALMKLRSIFVFTHDSIGLGEDGPTHQPVEHAASLRAMPQLVVIRPADANEATGAWRVAMTRRGPTALLLTRQAVPVLAGSGDVARGGYVLADSDGRPDLVLIATGSEVEVALGARTQLLARGLKVRVVSLPSWELFDAQPKEYQDSVLPPGVLARVAVEAGVPQGWERYVGAFGAVVGIENRFGASAPLKVVMERYGFTADNVAAKAMALVEALPARLAALGLARA